MPPQGGAVVAIRADSGLEIGSGHLMRCLTVAEALRTAGHHAHFLTRDHSGNLSHVIEARGFGVTRLPIDPSWMGVGVGGYDSWRGGSIVSDVELTARAIADFGGCNTLLIDHYGLDKSFESRMRAFAKKVVVIDDLHNRNHDCDMLIDHNIGHGPASYDGLVPGHCLRLVGSTYGMLNPAFAEKRPDSLTRRKHGAGPRALLVSVGGSDLADVSSRVLLARQTASLGLGWIAETHVVLSSAAPNLAKVRDLCNRTPGAQLHVDTLAMPELMAVADIAIGGAGVTAMERCTMGLPCLTIVMAENQASSAVYQEQAGASITVGDPEHATADILAGHLRSLHSNPDRLREMSSSAAVLCDGRGLARVGKALFELIST